MEEFGKTKLSFCLRIKSKTKGENNMSVALGVNSFRLFQWFPLSFAVSISHPNLKSSSFISYVPFTKKYEACSTVWYILVTKESPKTQTDIFRYTATHTFVPFYLWQKNIRVTIEYIENDVDLLMIAILIIAGGKRKGYAQVTT